MPGPTHAATTALGTDPNSTNGSRRWWRNWPPTRISRVSLPSDSDGARARPSAIGKSESRKDDDRRTRRGLLSFGVLGPDVEFDDVLAPYARLLLHDALADEFLVGQVHAAV